VEILDALMSKRAVHYVPNVWGQTPFDLASNQSIDLDMMYPELPPTRGTPPPPSVPLLFFLLH